MTGTRVGAAPAWKRVQTAFGDHDLRHVFIEHLGWGGTLEQPRAVEIDGEYFSANVLAELMGYRVFLIETPLLPAPKVQAAIDKELGTQAPERISIFSDGVTHQWRWPHQTPSGGVSFETLAVSATAMPSFLAQRLVGLAFSADDFAKGVGLLDVRDRVRGRFDGAKVTKKFFDEFKKRHYALAESIQGLESEQDRSTYATLLMNRLMLLYFLQKREFLNDDAFYLENCLQKVQGLQGKNHFYSFYRDLLLPMFFDRLAAFEGKDLDPDISKVLGDVPYINGGIYEPSAIERDFGKSLDIPDQIFEDILVFFGRFNWHLDTRPSGSENEINPEVIGYIFEQYINYTAGGKKANGAYYTKEDVTGYMVGATLVPRILDYCVELGIPFAELVSDTPLRYIHVDMLHGFDAEAKRWIPAPAELVMVWEEDPIGWHVLDEAKPDLAIGLPGETWVEVFYRRERVDKLHKDLAAGLVSMADDTVTHNLNGRLLLTDAIAQIDDAKLAIELWEKVTTLSVLDPTCGSGAFLFAAMEVLEDVYHHLIDVLRTEQNQVASAREIVEEIQRHPNDRYFVRKSIALNNLYGTDLMPDAIETAQLRIFLALVSCLDSKSEIEPLPDLAFNLKCGNLVVGFRDLEDLDRFGADLLGRSALETLSPEIDEYRSRYIKFVDASKRGESVSIGEQKSGLLLVAKDLRQKTNVAFADIHGIEEQDRTHWLEKFRPFHWFVEFPQVMQRGGFDVLIGNPPYIARKNLTEQEKLLIKTYVTYNSPDFYAVCYERSLTLLNANAGRHCFIVMLNLAFGNEFGLLRALISDSAGSQWWSTYGKRPDALFSGVQVRNTIVIISRSPGAASSLSTKHQIFTQEIRRWLFSGIEYSALNRGPDLAVIRDGVGGPITRAGLSSPGISGEPTDDVVYLKPTGSYWFPVLLTHPPVLSQSGGNLYDIDPGMKQLRLRGKERAPIVGAALAGKLGYFWWSATGDDFHINTREADFVRQILISITNLGELVELADEVWAEGARNGFVSENKGGYVNIRWSSARSATDKFDRLVMEKAGLLVHWRALNIWYRQTMRALRANTNSRKLSDDERERIFPT